MILWQYITQTDGAVWHVQPITLDMDPVRGRNGTRYVVRAGQSSQYIEAEIACSRQRAVHPADTAIACVFTHR